MGLLDRTKHQAPNNNNNSSSNNTGNVQSNFKVSGKKASYSLSQVVEPRSFTTNMKTCLDNPVFEPDDVTTKVASSTTPLSNKKCQLSMQEETMNLTNVVETYEAIKQTINASLQNNICVGDNVATTTQAIDISLPQPPSPTLVAELLSSKCQKSPNDGVTSFIEKSTKNDDVEFSSDQHFDPHTTTAIVNNSHSLIIDGNCNSTSSTSEDDSNPKLKAYNSAAHRRCRLRLIVLLLGFLGACAVVGVAMFFFVRYNGDQNAFQKVFGEDGNKYDDYGFSNAELWVPFNIEEEGFSESRLMNDFKEIITQSFSNINATVGDVNVSLPKQVSKDVYQVLIEVSIKSPNVSVLRSLQNNSYKTDNFLRRYADSFDKLNTTMYGFKISKFKDVKVILNGRFNESVVSSNNSSLDKVDRLLSDRNRIDIITSTENQIHLTKDKVTNPLTTTSTILFIQIDQDTATSNHSISQINFMTNNQTINSTKVINSSQVLANDFDLVGNNGTSKIVLTSTDTTLTSTSTVDNSTYTTKQTSTITEETHTDVSTTNYMTTKRSIETTQPTTTEKISTNTITIASTTTSSSTTTPITTSSTISTTSAQEIQTTTTTTTSDVITVSTTVTLSEILTKNESEFDEFVEDDDLETTTSELVAEQLTISTHVKSNIESNNTRNNESNSGEIEIDLIVLKTQNATVAETSSYTSTKKIQTYPTKLNNLFKKKLQASNFKSHYRVDNPEESNITNNTRTQTATPPSPSSSSTTTTTTTTTITTTTIVTDTKYINSTTPNLTKQITTRTATNFVSPITEVQNSDASQVFNRFILNKKTHFFDSIARAN